MNRATLILLLLLLATAPSKAQSDPVKQARIALKSKDLAAAEKAINQALTNEKAAADAATWELAGRIQKQKADQQMVNAYLKKSCDTLAIFDGVFKMTEYFLRCDSLAQLKERTGKANKYRKANARLLMAGKSNLINGGIYFYNKAADKQDLLDRAFQFFAAYVDMADSDMMAEEHIAGNDSVFTQTAYYAALVAVKLQRYENVRKYARYALNDRQAGAYALGFLAEAYKVLGDTEAQLATLQEGVRKYPDDDHFFANLIDYYSQNDSYADAMSFADEMLSKDDGNFLYNYVKGYLYQMAKDYDNALAYYKRTIELNPNYAEAYSNIGLIYCLLAQSSGQSSDGDQPSYRAGQQALSELYRKALPYYETARRLKPDQKALWLDGLYRVYYNLHMGDKFNEIEALKAMGT